jgi:hypothetical protein
MRVGLITCAKLPTLNDDDRLLGASLRARGIDAIPLLWDDKTLAWDSFEALVLRSCWDYHYRVDEFRAWLGRLEACDAKLWNPVPLVRENLHKGYLKRLAQAGVSVVPTLHLARGEAPHLAALLAERGWGEAVVKPAVSASAHETWTVGVENAVAMQARFDKLLAAGDVLVQPFMPTVKSHGEWSLVFLGGELSHAVLKIPRPGDFRVQEEFGGSVRVALPSARLRQDCETILERLEHPWLYARVDGIEVAGRFMLMELELIEPFLFLGSEPAAADRLASAVESLARGRRP